MADNTLNIDLSNYKDRVGATIPDGRYTVVVEDAEVAKSKAGNTMINLWFRTLDGGEAKGATIVDRLTLTEGAMFRVVGFMQAIGLPTPRKRLQVNLSQFIGKRLVIDVEEGEPYNGRTKSEVRGYLKSKGGAAAADEADLDDVADDEADEPTPQPRVKRELSPVAPAEDDSEGVDLDDVEL